MNILDWKASEDVINSRLSHCNACEHLNYTLGVCKQCLCVVAMKTALRQAECPIGKWKKVE